MAFPPPLSNTFPFCSSVAVWFARGTFNVPVVGKLLDEGSYSSNALVTVLLPVNPPAISTLPFGNRVAVWLLRATDIGNVVGVKVPVAGSYTSAEASGVAGLVV